MGFSRWSLKLWMAMLFGLGAIAGCRPPESPSPSVSPVTSEVQGTPPPERLQVIATILPMYLFTKAVAGEAAEVSILIPPGTEVHDYQSKPAEVQAIAQADVLVENNLGLEEFLEDTIKNAENPKLVVINASQGIEPLKPEAGAASHAHDHDHEEEPHAHAEGNPHVWLDPVLAKQQVENIRKGLVKADPRNQAIYQANASAYIQKLENLHQQFQTRLQAYPRCTFVSFHDAYPYLAKRYQLQQMAVVQLPEDSLSPADLQKTIKTVEKFNVKVLFGEPGVDNRLLQSLSQDLKLKVYPLDSLESGTLDPQYYFTAMNRNLEALEAGCR